jgi:hypothetical protein
MKNIILQSKILSLFSSTYVLCGMKNQTNIKLERREDESERRNGFHIQESLFFFFQFGFQEMGKLDEVFE